ALFGGTFRGLFGGVGGTLGGSRAILYGASFDPDNAPDAFAIGITDLPLHTTIQAVSETQMIVSASILQDALGVFMALRGEAGLSGTPLGVGIGLAVSVVINPGAVGTWIHYTYGKPSE